MMKNKYIIVTLMLAGFHLAAQAQDKKVWASGAARSVFQQNNLSVDGDTITPKRLNSGHTLVDLAINAKPNNQTFLHGKVRIRNDFGGFWGSGVTFDIRQLYVKGLIKNAIRYQLGDINYKLTPYTFYSNNEELSNHQREALNIFRDITRYDMFFTDDNTWRQQGAALDFSLEFDKNAEELNVNIFASRNRASDFNQQSDRIFFGGNVNLVQSKTMTLGANYIDLMDIAGTSRSIRQFHNPVITGTTKFNHSIKGIDLQLASESGVSEMYEINNASVPALRDYFYDIDFKGGIKKTNTTFKMNYINVGPQFRSVGAQTKRVNFQGQNRMYTQYGNDQLIRPISSIDLLQDVSLYQLSFNPDLDGYMPSYQNIQPYGKATPNRKGLSFGIEQASKNEAYNIGATYRMLSEVVGQGTDDLRIFNQIALNGTMRFNKIMANYEKPLEVSLAYTRGSTKRTTEFTQADVDLNNSIMDIGAKVGLIKDLDLLFNFRVVSSKGNELMSMRNDFTEVIDFQRFETDLSETMVVLGFRYSFSEKNKLNVVWQKMSWKDTKNANEAYDMSQFAIVYSLMF